MNSSERWERIKDIFESALSRTGSERRAFLEGACGSDVEMLREVESLLGSFDGDYLEGAAVEGVAEAVLSRTSIVLRPGTVVGQYEIIAELGKGGQGAVFRAIDKKLNRTVAIKALPPEMLIDETARKRFHREAQLASSLDHPNICSIHDLAEAGSTHLIVMQFVEGKNVRDMLRGRPLDLAAALRIAIQVCDALAAAHERGIIHRDIKAHNVIVTPNGTAKVLDFGLAKLTRDTDADRTELTARGLPYGTPAYAAPEQSRGETADHRSDIFSAGALLYELLTGTWPFHGKTAVDVRHEVMYGRPKPVAERRGEEVPEKINLIVNRALAKDPEERFESIAEMRDELIEVFRGLPDADTSENTRFLNSVRRFSTGKPRRRSIGIILAGSTLAAVVVGAFLVYRTYPDVPATPAAARRLTRLTFDAGLQSKPSWSPDGRFIAFYSDKSGNFDIWVQQVDGGEPVQITRSPAQDWQPDYSPDGNNIVFRSEREGGGLFVMPALGGTERKISSVGYDPHWSPDGRKILFYNSDMNGAVTPPKVYTINADGGDLREVWPQASREFVSQMRADWHPDGKRVSFLGQLRRGGLGFLTVPLDSESVARSEFGEEVARRIKEAGVTFFDFAWAGSGSYLFLEGEADGVRNLWKITVDPQTLAWKGGLERLTTGAGKDTEISVSPNGKRLAFSTQTERTRIWSFPFDAAAGKAKGEGEPVSPLGMDTGEFSLSPDNKRIAFIAKRAGKLELWQKNLSDGKESMLLTAREDDVISSPRWAADGGRIAFAKNHNPDPASRKFTQTFEKSIVLVPADDGSEQPLTSPHILQGWPWDWTSDGRYILGSSAVATPEPEHWGLYFFPTAAAPRAESAQKLVVDQAGYNFWQGRISPDGKWIVFLGAGVEDETDSFIGVAPITGGTFDRVVIGGDLDKPRWSPDGKAIYFYSNRSGFRNVWVLRFDPASGKPIGEASRVTDFKSPDRMLIGSPLIGHGSMVTDLAVAPDKLIVDITQLSGSVWVLDNVGDQSP